MFSKPKSDHAPTGEKTTATNTGTTSSTSMGSNSANLPSTEKANVPATTYQSKPKTTPSLLSADLIIVGNVITEGDIEIEGTVEGDVRASLLTVGETATIRGELAGEDVVVNGHVIGRLRGRKIRLTSTANVEGDIVHKTIAIEAGASFEGSVQRHDDPLADVDGKQTVTSFKSAKTTAAE